MSSKPLPLPPRAGQAGTLALAAVAVVLACVVLAGPSPALRPWAGGLGLAASSAARNGRRASCAWCRPAPSGWRRATWASP